MTVSGYKYAASEGNSTTTSTTYQDKLTLTLDGDETGTWWVQWMGELEAPGSTAGCAHKVYIDADTDITINEALTPRDLGDKWQTMGFRQITMEANPVSAKIQYAVQSGKSGTAEIERARIIMRPTGLLDNLVYADSEGESTTTSTSDQTKVTLPASSLDLPGMFIGAYTAEIKADRINVFTGIQLVQSEIGGQSWKTESTDGTLLDEQYITVCRWARFYLPSDASDLTLAYKSMSSGYDVWIRRARMALFKMY